MDSIVSILSYDAVTKEYCAELVVTDGEKTYKYTCVGTWHDQDAEMVAGALYDQHREALAKENTADAEKKVILAAISAEVDKKAAVAAEVK